MMMKKSVSFLLISLQISTTAIAASANLQMTGTISSECSFMSPVAGSLAVSPSTPNVIGTNVTGGAPASVGINYIGTPTITVGEITGFDSNPQTMPSGISYITYASTGRGGGMAFSGGSASYQEVTGNSDNITVDFRATSSGGAFGVGTYTASTTVTCQ